MIIRTVELGEQVILLVPLKQKISPANLRSRLRGNVSHVNERRRSSGWLGR